MPETKPEASPHRPATEVYAVYGVEPEVQAYAMAKYSRSALSMKESLREISEQKAEQFLNTFYFQYGHRSIADLAHIAFAVERLSLLAAMRGRTSSAGTARNAPPATRTSPSRIITFRVWRRRDDATPRQQTRPSNSCLPTYREFSRQCSSTCARARPSPARWTRAQYERTMRARAFDIARYLLPLATNTSLGQIVNARTLETQISRLLSHPQPEIRELGQALKRAARRDRRTASSAISARGRGCAHAGQVRRSQSLLDQLAPGVVRGGQGAHGPHRYRARPGGRSARR